MLFGVLDLSFWAYVAATLALTHVTIVSVTIYLHRHQAHRAMDLHPAVAHFFRFWLWLTTGMVTSQWVAVHRKHHAKVETADDPHSPQVYGIRRVLLAGTELYKDETGNAETLAKYTHGTPDDWLERNVYAKRTFLGIGLMLLIDLVAFGAPGLTVWAVQMAWIPFFAAGVINGVGHYWGYRSYESADTSTNIVPWGILIGGEELHNNHHAFASSARFSSRWFEFDIGWAYIRALQALGLARVKKLAPEPVLVAGKASPDLDTVRAVVATRFQVMARYARVVLRRVYAEEIAKADAARRTMLRRARALLGRDESLLSDEARARLDRVLDESKALSTVYLYKRRLAAIWQERTASHERLLQSLQEWCRQAEASGIRALQDFARTLPQYSLARQPV